MSRLVPAAFEAITQLTLLLWEAAPQRWVWLRKLTDAFTIEKGVSSEGALQLQRFGS